MDGQLITSQDIMDGLRGAMKIPITDIGPFLVHKKCFYNKKLNKIAMGPSGGFFIYFYGEPDVVMIRAHYTSSISERITPKTIGERNDTHFRFINGGENVA
jgi:hypothetical protein